jgi:hypothetical protein
MTLYSLVGGHQNLRNLFPTNSLKTFSSPVKCLFHIGDIILNQGNVKQMNAGLKQYQYRDLTLAFQ